MNEAENITAEYVREYLTINNFDKEKLSAADLVFGGGIGNTNGFYSFVLYKPGDTPTDALDFVTVEIDRYTKKCTIIPGTSPELEKFKK